MEATLESIYQLMRFNIVSAARKNLDECPFDSGYIYAWESGVYPAFNEGAEWHKPFPSQFHVTEDEVLELGEYLDDQWINKKSITFYELEDHYQVRGSTHSDSNWDRVKLLITCRYMCLNRMFDDDFWLKLTENGECPSEALSIARPLKQSDIYLM